MHVKATTLKIKFFLIFVSRHQRERVRSMLMNAVIQQDIAWKKKIINEKILHEALFKMLSCGVQ